MNASAPRDKYNAVWLIFFMLGLGTLLPWNFFMTANEYFTSRLADPSVVRTPTNGTDGTDGAGDGYLTDIFTNVMTLCAMVPLLICTCLNSLLQSRIPQNLRVMGSLAVILGVFMITAIIVKVTMEPFPFFCVTMIKIVIINSFGAILQGSLFGMAGLLPATYTTPIMSGQGLAGTFAAFSMICAIASGSEIQNSAFGYFITACAVIFLSILSYIALPKMEFFQYHQDSNKKKSATVEENALDLMKNENCGDTSIQQEGKTVSMMAILKKIWLMAFCVCFAFTVTIGVFPAVTGDVRSTIANGSAWELYFIPVSCFLLFNLCDWAGRSLTAVCMWPGKDSKLLPLLIVSRVVFVPLFILCNVQKRKNFPVYFEHDGWFIAFMVLFAFSNGYLASLCMCFGPKNVLPHEAETAGAVMAFFLSLGLALGALLSFPIRWLV